MEEEASQLDHQSSLDRKMTSMKRLATTAFSRARQFTEEKLGQVEKTTYDAQFENMVVRAETTKQWTERIIKDIERTLEPNPNIRLEGFLYQKFDRKRPSRMIPVEELGDTMINAGANIGPTTLYGGYLQICGEVQQRLGMAHREFMTTVVEKVLSPLKKFLSEDIKTIQKERQRLAVKRLDLDVCKNRGKRASTFEKQQLAEAQLRAAQGEFDSQYEMTKLLLERLPDIQASHRKLLQEFVAAQKQYYCTCTDLMTNVALSTRETEKPSVPSNRPRRARVLYDYDAADEEELSLLADEIVTVLPVECDKDWVVAKKDGQTGRVPVSYLEYLS
ncbi:endophilin-B1-like [Corticium candelabrum]|uniref:endophilin-B1-like n=1 Tax=Corticium candelabrum TaxID=121492 RepID=UPI002E273F44|nr:endophilin-B1-like [Corticium candelabrum]